MVIIWKKNSNCFRVWKIQLSKNKYWDMLLRETTFFAFFVLLRKARFNILNFTMRQIKKKLYNVSDFEANAWKRVRSWKKFAFKRSLYESCYRQKTTFFLHFRCFCEMHEIKIKIFFMHRSFVTEFEKKFAFERSRFEIR